MIFISLFILKINGISIQADADTTQSCTNQDCSLCKSDDPNFCVICKDKYGLVQDTNGENTGQCSSCQSNCLECQNDNQNCTKCEDGYYLSYNSLNKGECKRCFSCSKCVGTSTFCTECLNGGLKRYPNGTLTGECELCSTFCSECKDDYLKCTHCIEGYGIEYINGESTYKCQQL